MQREQRLEHARLMAGSPSAAAVRRAELRHQLRERRARRRRGSAVGELEPHSASSRAIGRSASTSGAYGIAAPPSSRQWPTNTRAPRRQRARDLELGDEPALADPGLAGDEGERGNARRRAAERAVESGELVRAADERG